jgi:hypothetical protein
MKLADLTLEDIARIGLFLDDPYGDGIRMPAVRNPSVGRQAALELLNGTPTLFAEQEIRDEYEVHVKREAFTRKGTLKTWIKRNMK